MSNQKRYERIKKNFPESKNWSKENLLKLEKYENDTICLCIVELNGRQGTLICPTTILKRHHRLDEFVEFVNWFDCENKVFGVREKLIERFG